MHGKQHKKSSAYGWTIPPPPVQDSDPSAPLNGSNFYFQGINVTIRCISIPWWKKSSFEALIGKEKCILFIFHQMYSEIPGTKFNY